jgi:hypothetical protein
MVSRGQRLRSQDDKLDSPGEECGETDSAVERKESREMGSVMEGMGGLGWRYRELTAA